MDSCSTCHWFTRTSPASTPPEGRCQLHGLPLWHPRHLHCRDHQAEAVGTGLPHGRATELLARVVLRHPQFWDSADSEVDVALGSLETVKDWTADEQLAAFVQAEAQAQMVHNAAFEEKQQQRVQRIIERRLKRKP